jgi:ATP-dependent protease ClpP protease subunit
MTKLPKLLALNKSVKRDFRAALTDGRAEIFIYDIIGEDFWTGGGVTAMMFVEALSKFKGADTIHLHINSPGGDVFEARAITAAMLAFPGKFVAHIDGLAASAASYIAARCDEVEISPGAFIMIHNGWTIAAGDRHAMIDCAALLEKIDASIAADYAAKTGLEIADLAAMMDAETWLDADKAIEMKFADRLAEKAQAVGNTWNLSAYQKAPEMPEVKEEPINSNAETDLPAATHDKGKRTRALRLAEVSA